VRELTGLEPAAKVTWSEPGVVASSADLFISHADRRFLMQAQLQLCSRSQLQAPGTPSAKSGFVPAISSPVSGVVQRPDSVDMQTEMPGPGSGGECVE
jgi:hypothetical protein